MTAENNVHRTMRKDKLICVTPQHKQGKQVFASQDGPIEQKQVNKNPPPVFSKSLMQKMNKVAEQEDDVSLCRHCHCMTHTIGVKDLCSKCGMHKKEVKI